MGVTSGAGTKCFVDRCLYFFFWPLCCLFFDLHILITPLVSSNSSYYIRRAASPEGIKLVVFYYLIVFEMWPEKRVGL